MTTTLTVAPATLNLRLYAGDDFHLAFVFIDKETAAAYPIDGEWAAEVRAPITSPDVLVAFTVVVTEAMVTISMTGEEVRQLLGIKDAAWDLQQVEPDGAKTWYRGAISASQDVTHE